MKRKLPKWWQATHAQLAGIIKYEPDTGKFFWKANSWDTRWPAGKETGKDGTVSIFGKRYKASRLAWFLITQAWPKEQIDHKNCNPKDNRWENLREASAEQNQQNKSAWKNKQLPIKNVYSKRSGGFRVRIVAYGKIYSKSFNSLEVAKLHATKMRDKLHGNFARHT